MLLCQVEPPSAVTHNERFTSPATRGVGSEPVLPAQKLWKLSAAVVPPYRQIDLGQKSGSVTGGENSSVYTDEEAILAADLITEQSRTNNTARLLQLHAAMFIEGRNHGLSGAISLKSSEDDKLAPHTPAPHPIIPTCCLPASLEPAAVQPNVNTQHEVGNLLHRRVVCAVQHVLVKCARSKPRDPVRV